MLDYKAVSGLPDKLKFSRNGRTAEASRIPLGEFEVEGHQLKVADAMIGGDVPPLPIRLPNGRHVVHAYQWDHKQSLINVCVVVSFMRQRITIARPLVISNSMRPDLTGGIIVDSGEVVVGGKYSLTLKSGLGDGYYPLVGVFNFGLFIQAVVLDFKLWQVRDVILLPGQVLDEFAIIRRVAPNAEPGDLLD